MQYYGVFYYCETESGATEFAAAAFVYAVEAFENAVEMLCGDACAGVGETDVVVFFVGAVAVEVYLSFSAAVGYGVVNEIAEDGVEHR